MMNKIASDAYSQGAYDALQGMDLPHHIKVAAADHLTKESELLEYPYYLRPEEAIESTYKNPRATASAQNVADDAARLEAEILRNQVKGTGSELAHVPGKGKGFAVSNRLRQLGALAKKPGIIGGLGLAGLGTAGALGAFSDEDDFLTRAQRGDLTNEEIAMLAGGTAALGAGGAYAAGLI